VENSISFKQAVELHYIWLLRKADYLTGKKEDAQDLVQDFWLLADKHDQQLEESRCKTFLTVALQRLFYRQKTSHGRLKKKYNNSYLNDLTKEEKLKTIYYYYPTVIDDIEKRQQIAIAQKVMSRLKPNTQAILNHAFKYDSVWQAGVDTEEGREAFKQRFLTARKTLRMCYENFRPNIKA